MDVVGLRRDGGTHEQPQSMTQCSMQQLHYSQGVTTQVRATLLRHFQATQAAIHCAAHTPAPPAQPCACQGSGPYAGL